MHCNHTIHIFRKKDKLSFDFGGKPVTFHALVANVFFSGALCEVVKFIRKRTSGTVMVRRCAERNLLYQRTDAHPPARRCCIRVRAAYGAAAFPLSTRRVRTPPPVSP